jgi:hypothetical protein
VAVLGARLLVPQPGDQQLAVVRIDVEEPGRQLHRIILLDLAFDQRNGATRPSP